MRKLYVEFYEDFYETTVFFGEKGTPFHAVNGNDGTWRDEYFNPVLEAYDIEVLSPPKAWAKKAKQYLIDECGYDFD